MALNAVHIRARNQFPGDDESEGAGWHPKPRQDADLFTTAERRSSSPPRTVHRPGLGSSSTASALRSQDTREWHSLSTGEPRLIKALRMSRRFVKATHLSDPSLRTTTIPSTARPEPDSTKDLQGSIAWETATSALDAPDSTLAELYSRLTQDMPSSVPQRTIYESSSSSSHTLPSADSVREAHARKSIQGSQRAHRRRHQADVLYRPEWFIAKAFTKMQYSQRASLTAERGPVGSTAQADALPSAKADVPSSEAQQSRRCARCGDVLPANASQDYMAKHRQSIGHRLGLNAPVSSASASEAPSPAPSRPATPLSGSGSPSTESLRSIDTDMQALPLRSDKPPRRLSDAPRWKKIARDNVGHNLLSRMGWKEGIGLGVQEWKWQQLCRDKVNRQRSNAVRTLLLRRASGNTKPPTVVGQPTYSVNATFQSSQSEGTTVSGAGTTSAQEEPAWLQELLQESNADASSVPVSLQAAFPFQLESSNLDGQREAAQKWLSNLAESDLEWFQCLAQEDRTLLEQALLSGQLTLEDIQEAICMDHDDHHFEGATLQQSSSAAACSNAAAEGHGDAMRSNALLYPVEVELRHNRHGIGLKRSDVDRESGISHGRRSRTAEGSIEIRRTNSPSSDLLGNHHKRSRPTSSSRPFRSRSRSRSRSGTAGGTSVDRHTDLTRRRLESAYQQEMRDWLDLRASLS
ncbi:G-patch domain-containing protein [Pseudozyma hubeiensis]|nr:G-patch domain-containing protein [Pseudozyma hubeiensis]